MNYLENMDTFKQAIEKAKEFGACEDAIYELERIKTIEEFKKHEDAPYWCYWFARKLERRCNEFEPIIKNSPYYSFIYVQYIIKERCEEFEPSIKNSPYHSFLYVRDIIKKRCEGFEPSIKTSAEDSYYYVKDIIKERCEEFEPIIKKDADYWDKYKNCFKIKGI